jgi:hypothetical protein
MADSAIQFPSLQGGQVPVKARDAGDGTYSLVVSSADPPGTYTYLRPGGVDIYKRPGDVDTYLRP